MKFIIGNSNYRHVWGFNSNEAAANDSLKQFKRITIIGKKKNLGSQFQWQNIDNLTIGSKLYRSKF